MRNDRPPRRAIADVLEHTDLAALLDEHTTAVGSGHRRRWHCPVPDHEDQHASVTIHTDARGHERWRCWSGDDTHRGDAIDLVMVTRHVDRGSAIELLASRAGLRINEPTPPVRRREPSTGRTAATGPVALDPGVERYVAACEQVLWTRTGRRTLDWLTDRGFSEETLRANRVGADPGRALMRRPRGLPSGRSVGATFPALDIAGDVAYVQTRYLQPAPGSPKYENPAGTLGSNPRLAWARPAAPTLPRTLVICEGIPDALTAAQHGLRAVGVLGAQAPDRRVAERLVRELGSGFELVAVVDADPAGRGWGDRLAGHLAELGVDLRVVEPPTEGVDLNDWARQDPTWVDAVAHPELPATTLVPSQWVTREGVSLP